MLAPPMTVAILFLPVFIVPWIVHSVQNIPRLLLAVKVFRTFLVLGEGMPEAELLRQIKIGECTF